jgi:hypothetical protein
LAALEENISRLAAVPGVSCGAFSGPLGGVSGVSRPFGRVRRFRRVRRLLRGDARVSMAFGDTDAPPGLGRGIRTFTA